MYLLLLILPMFVAVEFEHNYGCSSSIALWKVVFITVASNINAAIMAPQIKALFARKPVVANLHFNFYVHKPIAAAGVDDCA